MESSDSVNRFSTLGLVFILLTVYTAIANAQATLRPAKSQDSASNQKAESHQLDFDVSIDDPFANWSSQEKKKLESFVDSAFSETHQGFSADELLLDDRLRMKFVAMCQQSDLDATEFQYCWALLNLRKAGKLSKKSTKRRPAADLESILPLAESAARSIQDEHNVSTDKMIAHPELRKQFDDLILNLNSDADVYAYRKAAFRLRKTRKLKPELIVRVADWNKVVSRKLASEFAENLGSVPAKPGVYLFFDQSGYLYIGEAKNLRDRLKQHLDESDRASLANYFKQNKLSKIQIEIHAFDPQSDGRKVSARRAYESELIRTRNPRFNIRP